MYRMETVASRGGCDRKEGNRARVQDRQKGGQECNENIRYTGPECRRDDG